MREWDTGELSSQEGLCNLYKKFVTETKCKTLDPEQEYFGKIMQVPHQDCLMG